MLELSKKIGYVIGVALLISAAIFLFSLLGEGQRDLSEITNKHGIPYPKSDSGTQIFEMLAHTDLFLDEPVLGKELVLTVTLKPHDMKKILVGVRENSFWLSYPWITLYEDDGGAGEISRTVRIPLTDKLQAGDRSVDIMFWGETKSINGEGLADQTTWEIIEVQAMVNRKMPSLSEFKNYGRGLINRERAL